MTIIIDGTLGVPLSPSTGTLAVANGGTGVTTSTGSGANVLGTSPTITGATITVASTANPTFSAYVASNQSITSSTAVKVPFNTEEWDTNNNYDSTTNYRFTPTVAGYYLINSAVATVGGSTRAFAMVYKNGAEAKRGNDSSAAVNGVVVNALVSANGSTDYFEIYVYTNVGGTNLGGGATLSYFQASMVRSA
jgi:hypothetical protein